MDCIFGPYEDPNLVGKMDPTSILVIWPHYSILDVDDSSYDIHQGYTGNLDS